VSGSRFPGPAITRNKLSVAGNYLWMAMRLCDVSISEVARRAQLDPSSIAKFMKGRSSIKDETLARLCDIMGTPAWLEERIMNAAGYASRSQRQFVQDEGIIAEAEQRVAQEIAQRKKAP
jgi:transcriptional regulator with XRE-family HTH domain